PARAHRMHGVRARVRRVRRGRRRPRRTGRTPDGLSPRHARADVPRRVPGLRRSRRVTQEKARRRRAKKPKNTERMERPMELKGSKTEQNLKTAFAGESEARNKYTYYASKA